jgi:hypothetical protein
MARLTGSVLGNLSGKLGNLSARTREGRTILSARPSSFTVNYSPAAVAVRQKFAVTVALMKSILELPALKTIWTKLKDPGLSAANTIFRDNFPLASTDRPTNLNIITPGGFDIDVTNAVVGADTVSFDIGALNTKGDFTNEDMDVEFDIVVCYYNPVDPSDPPYSLINLINEEPSYVFSAPLNKTVNYNVSQQNLAAKYQNNIMYIAIATKNTDGKVNQYSSTLAFEG